MTTTARSYMESLGLDESLARLQALLGRLAAVDETEATAKAAIAVCREELTSREAQLILDGLEGKNETERKAALRARQDKDADYLSILKDIHKNEVTVSVAQTDGAALRRESQYHRIKLEVGMAKLAFLKGPDLSGLESYETAEQPTRNNGRDIFG